jgi:hypothetical protein
LIEMHKVSVGQIVQFRPDRNEIAHAARGPYEVIQQLPHNGREHEYRIKSAHEEHVRGATEGRGQTGRGDVGATRGKSDDDAHARQRDFPVRHDHSSAQRHG